MATRTTRFRQGNIDPQHWDRLKTILGEALEQNSSAARIALVEQHCGQDTDLLEEAESLLAEAEALAKAVEDWANLRGGAKEVEDALATWRSRHPRKET